MTEIKTARLCVTSNKWAKFVGDAPVPSELYGVFVHGLTEAEVHEAAALLAKSREVCEYTEVGTKIVGCVELPYYDEPEYCPSCGRKVVVK